MDQLHRYTKLSYRVVFPLELRLFNTSGDATNPDRLYDLVAVVVHCGSGPNRGHYITIVKSHGFWLLFDDDIVEKIDAQAIEEFYGLTSDISKNSESGYILFYQSRDWASRSDWRNGRVWFVRDRIWQNGGLGLCWQSSAPCFIPSQSSPFSYKLISRALHRSINQAPDRSSWCQSDLDTAKQSQGS